MRCIRCWAQTPEDDVYCLECAQIIIAKIIIKSKNDKELPK